MMLVRWGSHGDYRIIALVPDSPQECFDLAIEAFNLSEIYRVPVFIMTDETVGHMHEKVVIPPAEEIRIVKRNWYTGPKEDYWPYDFNAKRSGGFSEEALESAAFTAFLFGRMVGCAGEIDDHVNRGRNMDTRTPASQCSYVV
jgi:pyruvate/2-oxoacid:ferredoxin oxidoreductase alpha subunit